MKRTYERPLMRVERFVPNEYVAACGDTNQIYKFVCDTPEMYDSGVLTHFYDSNLGEDMAVALEACGATHEASTSDPFVNGWMDYNKNGQHDSGEDVIVWIEIGGRPGDPVHPNNYHATTHVDMSEWETDKS